MVIVIPETEYRLLFSRSGGPGGQNVNRRETRVQLQFDVRGSGTLSAEQKIKVLTHPAVRHLLDDDGVMQVAVDTHRSQRDNIEAAVERLQALIGRALMPRKNRVPTKASKASKRRRLEAKKQHSQRKSRRRDSRQVSGE